MRLRMNRAIVGYILAGIAMLVLFLYLRFPGEALTDYVKAAAAARYPGATLSIDTIRPSFPPGVALCERHGRLPGPSGGDPPCGPPDHPARGALPAPGASRDPRGGGGLRRRGAGTGRFLATLFPPGTAHCGGEYPGYPDREVRLAPGRAGPPDHGDAEGVGLLQRDGGGAEERDGNHRFHADERDLPLLESFLGFEKIDFSKVEGKVSFRNGALKITELTLTGEKLRCSLKGNILLADDFRDSQIDLNGTIEIPVQGNKRVTLAISGTLGNPQTRIM